MRYEGKKKSAGCAEFEAETETGAVNGMGGQFRFQRAIFLSFFPSFLFSTLSLSLSGHSKTHRQRHFWLVGKQLMCSCSNCK